LRPLLQFITIGLYYAVGWGRRRALGAFGFPLLAFKAQSNLEASHIEETKSPFSLCRELPAPLALTIPHS
jgi:hypothetical protein